MPIPMVPGVDWYDRQGRPLADYAEVTALLEDPGYRVVRQTQVSEAAWVSTSWLGLDHSLPLPGRPRVPLIFETMVFSMGTLAQLEAPDGSTWCERYTTEEQAVSGHGEAIAWALALEGCERAAAAHAGNLAATLDAGRIAVNVRTGAFMGFEPRGEGPIGGVVRPGWHDEARAGLAAAVESLPEPFRGEAGDLARHLRRLAGEGGA